MYAVVLVGGKQYKVTKGEVINVDNLGKKQGETVELDKVLMIADKDNVVIGNPVIKDAKVIMEVVKSVKGKKVIVFTYRPKKGYKKIKGHRQKYTSVMIKEIVH